MEEIWYRWCGWAGEWVRGQFERREQSTELADNVSVPSLVGKEKHIDRLTKSSCWDRAEKKLFIGKDNHFVYRPAENLR